MYSYEIEKIEPQKFDGISISSTKIRKAITEDKFEDAKNYLGHYFSFRGTVVKGRNIGKQIGYPTANIKINNDWKLLPNDGVYAVYVNIGLKEYKGMMNIGFNPTFDSQKKSIEIHILDFKSDIYGEGLKVSVVKKIRKEKKFSSVEELKKVLKLDENKVRQLLNKKNMIEP